MPPFLVSHLIQPENPQPSILTHYDIPIAESNIDYDTESEVKLLALPGRTPQPYSNQTISQTNIHPTPFDELFTQFEGEDAGRLNALIEACTYNANLSEVCALTNNFRSVIEVSYEELEISFLKEAKTNFHVRLSGIVEPLLHKVPPTFMLPTPAMTPPPSPNQNTMVSSEILEDRSNPGLKKTVVSEEFI